MAKNFSYLIDKFKGRDIYVIGSGSSLDYVDKSFFDQKITIGANRIHEYIDCLFLVLTHRPFIEEACNHSIVIASEFDCADFSKKKNDQPGISYTFRHYDRSVLDFEKIKRIHAGTDTVHTGKSTIHACIHISAMMGAKNIILCGHDCVFIDGKSHIGNYGEYNRPYHGDNFDSYHSEWFDEVNSYSVELKKKIRAIYGCNIVSLNPFINMRMEGHDINTKK